MTLSFHSLAQTQTRHGGSLSWGSFLKPQATTFISPASIQQGRSIPRRDFGEKRIRIQALVLLSSHVTLYELCDFFEFQFLHSSNMLNSKKKKKTNKPFFIGLHKTAIKALFKYLAHSQNSINLHNNYNLSQSGIIWLICLSKTKAY